MAVPRARREQVKEGTGQSANARGMEVEGWMHRFSTKWSLH
jgi:hypothetical protein